MAEAADSRTPAERVDASLKEWRQGDCVLGEQWFVYRLAAGFPISDGAKEAAAQSADLAETPVMGMVVVSQTCEIVRNCVSRPFIEVAALVEVEESQMLNIERARQPRYAFIPALASKHLVADLDRTMTLEKPVVALWLRIPGCRDDKEAREFARALARKRERFAFPDDFNVFAKGLSTRFKEKHGKNSSEGRALQALREVRIRAAPSWDAAEVQLHFWFIRHDAMLELEGKRWDEYLQSWLALIPVSGRFKEVDGVVVTLDRLTAREYLESDSLDLDHLSAAN